MTNPVLYMDTGYSSLKAMYNGQFFKIPTAVSFSNATIENFSNGNDIYSFEGHDYVVGVSDSMNTFVTTDFKMKLQLEPLIIKKFRDTLKITDGVVCDITLSLALNDWKHKDELVERCKEFVINNSVIRNNIKVIPQGLGAYTDYVVNSNNNVDPSKCVLIDIGFNTINFMQFIDGSPNRSSCKGYPGHGVTSIITPFTNYMESKFGMQFNNQECVDIFTKGTFTYAGMVDDEVSKAIIGFKNQFIQSLFNSLLIADKKVINTSEVVIIAGGGSYILDEITLPPNFKIVNKPFEYSNVRGMSLISLN